MNKLFIYIYEWFERHRIAFYTILVSFVAVCIAMASQISLQENITNFFNSSDKKNATFENLAIKDKIVVLFSGEEPDSIISAAEIFEEEIYKLQENGLVESITAYADGETISKVTSFVYEYLPIFLTEDDYKSLDEKLSSTNIKHSINNVYNLLTSPTGMVIGDIVMRDPLNIGTPL